MKNIFLTLFCCMLFSMTQAQVMYIGHRGASYLAPENTIASDKLAWELGADAVELDIHLSKDNKIMSIHDGNTKRTSGQDFAVKETNSAVLRKLDVGSFKDAKYKGEKIPFLNEVIKTVPSGKKLVVELKSRGNVFPQLKKIVKRSGKLSQLVFICFDWETIVEAKHIFPKNSCYWLCGNKEALMKKMKEVTASGIDGLDLDYSIIDQEVMAEANKYKLDVVAYTVDKPEEAKRLISLGVKGITTNRPDWLKEQVSK